ncbi:D-alanine--poly(phosphoribitol) ligase subunit DltA [Candidatus Kaiserbacteria bacterium]|nr:D-alanine--poly(phosphoribitol) ligase subunit DltA [Candidatus Kaiserbacteria bacterium]
MDILEKIESLALQTPDHSAYISGERTLTYGELAQQSDVVAAFLRSNAPWQKQHPPIAVYGHKEPEMLIAFLGCIKAGHAYVPVDASIPDERARDIVELSHAATTLTPENIAEIVRNNPLTKSGPWRAPKGDEPFYIMFTSGSTGRPKGVIITADNVGSFLHWMLDEQKFITQAEVFLDQAPYSFDMSVMSVFPSLVTGNTLWSISKDDILDPARMYRRLAGSHITTWASTPSFARLCLAEKTFAEPLLPGIKRFLFCGETLSPHVASSLMERFPHAEIWNTYGPTEATVATTSVRVDQGLIRKYDRIPLGYPRSQGKVRIMRDGVELPVGDSGEIVITGPHVSPGYLDDPVLTQCVFFETDGIRSYRTGDRGYVRDGLLFFEGRLDDQIKLHGYRIEIGDIETNLRMLPGVHDAAVIVKTENGTPNSLAAFVILTSGHTARDPTIARSLRAQLGKRLPLYMVPRTIRFVGHFPLTANGKVDRTQLAEHHHA